MILNATHETTQLSESNYKQYYEIITNILEESFGVILDDTYY